MRHFCPKCWSDFPRDLPSCPNRGQDMAAFWTGKDYVDKLIAALKHREPETPIRAAWTRSPKVSYGVGLPARREVACSSRRAMGRRH